MKRIRQGEWRKPWNRKSREGDPPGSISLKPDTNPIFDTNIDIDTYREDKQ